MSCCGLESRARHAAERSLESSGIAMIAPTASYDFTLSRGSGTAVI